MENIKNFGPNLRRIIDESKYKTYQKAADAFEISLSYLQQLMRSEREPSLELLLLIGEKLHVSSSRLLGDIKIDKDRATGNEKPAAELLTALYRIAPTLDNDELEAVLLLANELSSGRALGTNKGT